MSKSSVFTTAKPSGLQVGDTFADGTVIVELYRDVDGTWIETDDGDCGYLDDGKRYRIYRR